MEQIISEFISAFDGDLYLLNAVKNILLKYKGNCAFIKDLATSINISDEDIAAENLRKASELKEYNIQNGSDKALKAQNEYKNKATNLRKQI